MSKPDKCACGRIECEPRWRCPRCGPRCNGEAVLTAEDASFWAERDFKNPDCDRLDVPIVYLPWRCRVCWAELEEP